MADTTQNLDPDTASLLASIERGLHEAARGEGRIATRETTRPRWNSEMNARTDIHTINGPDGKPVFAVIPYPEYLTMAAAQAGPTIPNEVVGLVVKRDFTPVRAWREHLGLTQSAVAQRLGISQSAYAQQEKSTGLRSSSREKIAFALGLTAAQLDF